MNNKLTSGRLFIVATPIGNLADITYRAVQVLQNVDLIAAEDTRHSRLLLNHFHINKAMLSLHDFNEEQRCQMLINELKQGKDIALISDAGTPLISDPGYVLVNRARAENITVIPIPGACAAIAALSASGLPADHFLFAGFLPNKSSARKTYLEQLRHETGTLIFYESPHRVKDLLDDLQIVFGSEREVVIARELTKAHETFYRGPIEHVNTEITLDAFGQTGEFVVLIKGATFSQQTHILTDDIKQMIKVLCAELPTKQAVRIAAEISGEPKNQLYEYALSIKDKK